MRRPGAERTTATGSSVASEADSADLVRLTVAVDPQQVEAARAVLVELTPAGWSESHGDDGSLLLQVWIARRDVERADRVRACMAAAGVDARIVERPESPEWREGLRRHHRPIDIAERLRVRPPWAEPLPGAVDVVIDPGMAFGTGQHATTRGCLRLLLDLPVGRLLDVGTGSGVIAIAAAKLGHGPVTALDTDPLAVEAARRNAAANAVIIDVVERDGAAATLATVDAIVANITRIHVAALADRLAPPLPRFALLSGFRVDDAASALAPWVARGYRRVDDVLSEGWAAVALESAP